MWNSPRTPRDLQLTPRQASGLSFMLGMDLDGDDGEAPIFMSPVAGFEDVPREVILREAMRVIETLVTETPPPEGGHSALHEGILYGLAVSLFEMGADLEQGIDTASDRRVFLECYLEPINAIRRLAGQRALKTLAHTGNDSWEDTLDSVFFWDRDWEMRETFAGAERKRGAAVKEFMGIDQDYYRVDTRMPSADEVAEAERRFRAIARFGDMSPRKLPPGYLDRPHVGLIKPVGREKFTDA